MHLLSTNNINRRPSKGHLATQSRRPRRGLIRQSLVGLGINAVNQIIKPFFEDQRFLDLLDDKCAEWVDYATGHRSSYPDGYVRFSIDALYPNNPNVLKRAWREVKQFFEYGTDEDERLNQFVWSCNLALQSVISKSWEADDAHDLIKLEYKGHSYDDVDNELYPIVEVAVNIDAWNKGVEPDYDPNLFQESRRPSKFNSTMRSIMRQACPGDSCCAHGRVVRREISESRRPRRRF